MIQDLNLQLDAKVAITTTAASSYYVDLLAAGDQMPDGVLAQFKALVTTTFTTLTSLKVDLQTASDTAFTSPVTLLTTGTVLAAALVAQSAGVGATNSGNAVLIQAVIPAGCLRYLRAYYTVVGSVGAGNLTAEIVLTGDKLISPTLTPMIK